MALESRAYYHQEVLLEKTNVSLVNDTHSPGGEADGHNSPSDVPR